MTCPKCGKELIIGSTLCPECDILEDKIKPSKKGKRKLTRMGKMIIGVFIGIVLLLVCIGTYNYAYGFKVQGIENGNHLSGSVAVWVKNSFFYTDGTTLYETGKKYSEHEVVDKVSGGVIYGLTECGDNLYYVKNGVICRYNPKKRVKSDILKVPSESKIASIGKSRYEIIFLLDNKTYKFDTRDNSFSQLFETACVISNSSAYLFRADGVFKANMKNGETERVCDVTLHEMPAFSIGSTIYSIDLMDMEIIATGVKTGERVTVFKCSEHPEISDVKKLDTDGMNFYFIGSNGVYKRNISGGEIKLTGVKGFVSAIAISDNNMLCHNANGDVYICNLDGDILYSLQNNVNKETVS